MSAESLIAFLEKLDKELEGASEPYRRAVADVRPHTFRISTTQLASEILTELADPKRGIAVTGEVEAVVFQESKTFVAELAGKLRLLENDNEISISKKHTRITDTDIKFTFKTLLPRSGDVKPWEFDPNVTFERIKLLYDPLFTVLFQNLKTSLKELGESLEGKKGGLLNLSHEIGKGIFETRLADAINSATESIIHIAGARPEALTRDLERLGLDLGIRRDDSTDTMEVFLGGKRVNASEGQLSNKNKKEIQAKIKEILESGKIGQIADLEGSDSPATRKRKQAHKKINKAFSKLANVKVKSKDTKIEDSSTGVKKKVGNKTGAKKGTQLKAKKVKAKRVASESPASQPLKMLGILNAQLPDTVRKNMGPPRLTNRTGRFASSVKVTDIQETAQGFPSIGYTYQRNPYETFEQGNARGSQDFDPRSLIDFSIREIATQFAMGRFYTRRV